MLCSRSARARAAQWTGLQARWSQDEEVLVKVEIATHREPLRLALHFCRDALPIPPSTSPPSSLIPGNDDGRCCAYREGAQLVQPEEAKVNLGIVGCSKILH